jgi:hypothetical protein
MVQQVPKAKPFVPFEGLYLDRVDIDDPQWVPRT